MENNALGIGLYTVPEASKMLSMQNQKLRRWLLGYKWKDKKSDKITETKPLWFGQYETNDDGVFLGFRDLVEARVINALVQQKISLQTIRICLNRAREILDNTHPLSTKQFKTDGKSIFLQITEDVNEPELVDLKTRQGVFNAVVAPSLKGIEFDVNAASRWYLNDKKTIVADPKRSFGQPIISDYGITTSSIFQAVISEGSKRSVASLFEIKQSLVDDVILFEQKLNGNSVH